MRTGNRRTDKKKTCNRRTCNWRTGNRRKCNRRTGNSRTGNRRKGNSRTGNRRTGNRRTVHSQPSKTSHLFVLNYPPPYLVKYQCDILFTSWFQNQLMMTYPTVCVRWGCLLMPWRATSRSQRIIEPPHQPPASMWYASISRKDM